MHRFSISSKSAFYHYKFHIMKKTLGLVAILAIICLTLTGCNSNKNPEWDLPLNNLGITNTPNEENVNVALPEGVKTSLTNDELDQIIDENFPISYSYTVYNTETDELDSWEYIYPEDLSHTLLIPEHATMASRNVVSSAIEDEMIYTDTEVKLQDGTEIKVLYIVEPETMQVIAASVQNGNVSRNYQFAY